MEFAISAWRRANSTPIDGSPLKRLLYKSPTVMPLAIDGWSSIHTVIPEDAFWEKINELKQYGAEGILVTPIEKIIE
jgi:ATP phosphoribosyltransferase